MPTPPKTSANMTKNMTESELSARLAAEAEILPDRGRPAELVPPPLMKGNAKAAKYWKQIIDRMEGYSILDDLDSDTLGIYCVQLARYDSLCKTIKLIGKKLNAKDDAPDKELAEAIAKLDSLSGKAQRLESNILQYADKLGLTPSGRVRLAQKRAEQAAAAADPDGDLYGD